MERAVVCRGGIGQLPTADRVGEGHIGVGDAEGREPQLQRGLALQDVRFDAQAVLEGLGPDDAKALSAGPEEGTAVGRRELDHQLAIAGGHVPEHAFLRARQQALAAMDLEEEIGPTVVEQLAEVRGIEAQLGPAVLVGDPRADQVVEDQVLVPALDAQARHTLAGVGIDHGEADAIALSGHVALLAAHWMWTLRRATLLLPFMLRAQASAPSSSDAR